MHVWGLTAADVVSLQKHGEVWRKGVLGAGPVLDIGFTRCPSQVNPQEATEKGGHAL